MISSVPVTKTTVGLIDQLRIALDNSDQPSEWLIITHDDGEVLPALHESFDDVSPAVLQVAHVEWDFRQGEMADAISWATAQGGIKNIVLAASSRDDFGGCSGQKAACATEYHAKDEGYSRLTAGVARNAATTREIQSAFADCVLNLVTSPSVSPGVLSGELAVYGLLYRHDSSLFLAYDVDRKAYVPLVA